MAGRYAAAQAQDAGKAPPTAFGELAKGLAAEVVERLDQEHRMEVDYMWQEQQTLRAELTRIVELMTKEVVPRERMMHELIEKIQHSYEAATAGMHNQITDRMSQTQDSHGKVLAQKQAMIAPAQEMEQELQRIQALLSHGPVGADIQGWQPGQYTVPGQRVQVAPGTGSSSSPQVRMPASGGTSSPTGGMCGAGSPVGYRTAGTGSPSPYTSGQFQGGQYQAQQYQAQQYQAQPAQYQVQPAQYQAQGMQYGGGQGNLV